MANFGQQRDFLSDDEISDVNPDELQKMLEDLDFSDSADIGPTKKASSKASSPALKSSIKSSGEQQPPQHRKVQFSKDTKDEIKGDAKINLANSESYAMTAASSGKIAGSSSSEAEAGNGKNQLSNAAGSTKTAAVVNKVGHPNKSKVMHDLFGIEKDSSSTDLMASATTSRRVTNKVEKDDDDDLFAGLGGQSEASRRTNAAKSNNNNSDFMSSLFGSSKTEKSASRDFVLDEKYKSDAKASAASNTTMRSSRRGSPFIGSTTATQQQPKAGPSSSSHPIEAVSDISPKPLDPNPVIIQSQQPQFQQQFPANQQQLSNANDNVKRQMAELEAFEAEQEAKFMKEIEEHKRHLELQQSQHRTILDAQRHTAQEQMRSLQEKQSLALKQQQGQCEMLMKQLQSQMEAEMRLKTELVRNQMQMISENSGNLDKFENDTNNNEGGYSRREQRLKAAHEEEMAEMQKRIQHWVLRNQQMSEEHQKELEAERERRRKDLAEQSQDHKATVETIRADYSVLVDKIKELKAMELEASLEAKDSSKAIDTLLVQMTSNMDQVSGLRQGLEDRLSKHVDVREALIRKKDEQLSALQEELARKGQESMEEQKRLREMVEKLETQMSQNDVDLRSREATLRRSQDRLEEERRKLETEREITLAHLAEDKISLQSEREKLEEERRQLHRAIEKEHRKLLAHKAKMTVSKRLQQGQSQRPTTTEMNEVTSKHEVEAMIKAVEAERQKLAAEWEAIMAAKNKLTAKRDSLRADKKVIDEAVRKLASIDRSLEKRMAKVDNLVEDSRGLKSECCQMMDECRSIENARAKAISEAKAEAVQRLEAVEREAQRLESIREAANKERRRLLHTRTAVLCTRCQKPLIEDAKIELSNLGLRTAGDGETLSSSLHHQFASLRKDAQRDQEYLAREAHYLQSIATAGDM